MLTGPAPRAGSARPHQQSSSRDTAAHPTADQRIADGSRLLPLLSAAATGDRGALARMYDLLAPTVLAVVRALVDDEDAVERIVIDTFGQVWRQAPLRAATTPDVAAWVLALAVRSVWRTRQRGRGGRA